MQIEVKTLPKSEVKLIIELTEEEMGKYNELAAKQVSEMVKIPGFRPGHVPPDVLKQHVSEETLAAHMLDIAVPEIYSAAVLKEKIKAVSRPKVSIVSEKPLKLEAVVAIYPEVKVSGYEKMDIPKKEVKVTPEEVEHVLNDIQQRHAKYVEVDRAAKMKDKVEIDFEGFDEGGAPLENTKSTNHPLLLGEKTLVEGFEEELVGLKKGEKKTFHITFPKDYFHKKFQGKKVEFRVEVKKVEEVVLPEFTPEFIKQLAGSEKTMDELKKIVEENLLRDHEYEEKVRRENEVLEKLIDKTQVEIPESLIEEELDGMIDEMKSDLENRGIPFDKFLEQSKKELKDLRADRRKEALKRLTLRFGLQQVFEQDHLSVSEDELKKEIEHVISLYPEHEREKLKKEYTTGSYLVRRLENKLKMDKLFERLLP
jgi:trigger factor